VDLVDWLNMHDEHAQRLAKAGTEFAKMYLVKQVSNVFGRESKQFYKLESVLCFEVGMLFYVNDLKGF